MGVIRVEHNANYTTMSNYHLRDERLSLRAIGLMSKMLSLPEDWDYTVKGLCAIVKEGREAVRKALMELEAAGYLVREQGRSAGGNFASNDYTLFEEPRDLPLPKKPTTVEPTTVEPTTVLPTSVNQPQLNNLINKETNKQKHAPAAAAKWEPDMFERFWKAYPCHKDKVSARREWDKLKPDRELMQVMSAALARAKTSDTWQRGIGIPYACRWLSHRRWEDMPDSDLEPLVEEAPERRLAGARC